MCHISYPWRLQHSTTTLKNKQRGRVEQDSILPLRQERAVVKPGKCFQRLLSTELVVQQIEGMARHRTWNVHLRQVRFKVISLHSNFKRSNIAVFSFELALAGHSALKLVRSTKGHNRHDWHAHPKWTLESDQSDQLSTWMRPILLFPTTHQFGKAKPRAKGEVQQKDWDPHRPDLRQHYKMLQGTC